MINLLTGSIGISNSDIVIDKDLTKEKFENTLFFKEHLLSVEDMKTGYVWYRTNSIKFEEILIKLSFCFYYEELYLITFRIQDDLNIEIDWSNWNKEKELELKRIHDKLLLKAFNREPDNNIEDPIYRTTYNFIWGSIESSFDSRSGSSLIAMRYFKQ
ncbi:hypothetical protein [Gorillibacterium massiliense]|uniref:hypothetical protein n=1 Tax=Gorillibacterium massiliense TaxID=1280390 RepID=UPI000594EAEC|nr:hypothetical protein [Gorillibacterium massiliense]